MTKKTESTAIANLNNLFGSGGALAETMAEANTALADSEALSKATGWLPRLQLFSGGKLVKRKLIEEGNFGIPKSADEVVDLGSSVDVLVIWRKPKAIDMSDTDNIIVSNETQSKEFQRIVNLADNTKDSGCAYGPAYLVFERSSASFLEYFAGNASGRRESANINLYLPVTPDMIKNGQTEEKEPRFSKPMTLKSQYVERGPHAWYAPKAEECLTPFAKLPTEDEINTALKMFLKKEGTGVKTKEPEDGEETRKSRAR